MTIHIGADALADFCAEVFEHVGCRPDEARRVAASLVDANLTGHDSHGIIRMPRYVDWVRCGDIVPNQAIERLVDTPVIAVVDGQFGFGQTVAPQAVDLGIEKAKAAGLSAISLRNSGHVGRVGEWAERAAAAGLISIHFVNAAGSILVAPFGGLDRRLSTAPFCAGIPREGAAPIVLDFATSLVAEGKINVASRGGKPLPPDALIGPDGAVSGDPALLYGPLTSDGLRNSAAAAERSAPSASIRAPASRCSANCSAARLRATAQRSTAQIRQRHVLALRRPESGRPLTRLRRGHDALSRLVPKGQDAPGPGDPKARRAGAHRTRETQRARRAAAERGLGVNCCGGAQRGGEAGPL